MDADVERLQRHVGSKQYEVFVSLAWVTGKREPGSLRDKQGSVRGSPGEIPRPRSGSWRRACP